MSDAKPLAGVTQGSDSPTVGVSPGCAAPQGPVPGDVRPEDWIVEGEADGREGQPEGRLYFGARKGKALVKSEAHRERKPEPKVDTHSAEWRLLILDTWLKSGLPAEDFVAMLGGVVRKHTLYDWKRRFTLEGPTGLVDKPRGGGRRSRLADVTRRSILMMKEAHPEWGCERISDSLLRGPGLSACATTVGKVLHEAGYETVEEPTKAHGVEPKRFERAKPCEMWQSDLFTFMLKRQNRRVHLVAFMDDHSRFIVSYALHATASAAFVIEALRAGVGSYGAPAEMLTDNGTQYKTWRGKSAFSKELERHGISHVVASPRHPQTLGKIERFWGTLWEECVAAAVFLDLEDARKRIGHFIDHYNFQRPHRGIEGLVPSDRFFGAAPDVLKTLKSRVSSAALDLAKNGVPRRPFYVTGQVGGRGFSVHAEGERVILNQDGKPREEVELVAPSQPPPEMPAPVCPQGIAPEEPVDAGNEEPPAPGTSPLDEGMKRLREAAAGEGGVE